jgi:glutamate--cysteine ligase
MLPLAGPGGDGGDREDLPGSEEPAPHPERHTRNSFYLMNVARLMEIFHQAGLNVRLGTLDEAITAPTPVPLPDGTSLTSSRCCEPATASA